MAAPWAHRYAQRTKTAKSSIIRELLKLTQRPEVISFAGGLPAPEIFPVERFREACQKVLTTNPSIALQYGPTEGYLPLRELIVAHIARYGILATVDNILITSGSQQALHSTRSIQLKQTKISPIEANANLLTNRMNERNDG